MEKVGAYTERATAEGEWRPGNPSTGQQATPMLADWFNMLQRELLQVLADSGLTPDINDDGQLAQAIQQAFTNRLADSVQAQDHQESTLALTPKSLIDGVLGVGSAVANGHVAIPYRDVATGEFKRIILQWVTITAGNSTTHPFPIAFPSECWGVAPMKTPSTSGTVEYIQVTSNNADNFTVVTYTDVQNKTTGTIAGARFFAIGH